MNVARLLVLPLALAALSARAEAPAVKPRIVEISVTKDGFVPAEVTVKKGEPVKLVVTRRVEASCATEMVSKELGLKQELPYNRTVAVTVTPQKAGRVEYACAMGHIRGALKVE